MSFMSVDQSMVNSDVAADGKCQITEKLAGAYLDYAIDLLTFSATDYSKVNLKLSIEQFELVAELVKHGLVQGEFLRDGSSEVTGILVGEITEAGVKFLDELSVRNKQR